MKLWSIYRRSDGLLDGAMKINTALDIYGPRAAEHVALRRNYAGRPQMRHLCTALYATSKETSQAIRDLSAKNPNVLRSLNSSFLP